MESNGGKGVITMSTTVISVTSTWWTAESHGDVDDIEAGAVVEWTVYDADRTLVGVMTGTEDDVCDVLRQGYGTKP